MKLLLVINVADDAAEDYKNFTVDYDLRGEDEDGDIVSISYIEDCPLKPMPQLKNISDRKITYEELRERIGWNACIYEILNDE